MENKRKCSAPPKIIKTKMGTRGVVLIVAASLARCASGFAVTRDVAGSVSPRALRAVPIYSAARSGGFLIGDYSKSSARRRRARRDM